ncbi:MAG: hypothetical protein A2W97_13640 [Bacteroidetes bacterium GWE2_40_63]|nr:MAG: hypothetical protein A2W95_15685 [Bacteroidetes bacterium GWA2_40_14]OFX58459.1 MAG: hypothetical protein A2W84_12770 [Bacteroidetes bacterium GWC2_40_13]OFX71267.1 MAG: hypothetical protein A2W96_16275 [Bacteroidetes bacterium GWD2_40_43]OFX89320.1 MAG: hypothetical protein A2W97_13640 [Bacteroidetes bacterium GWE2_40_63]OFY23944.1 MAG: hypothetical protein A2W88_12220 [Bacteroidetes bacterium GWF2_40_13]OFZ32318.1 MAG: hypothetical protein A2437_20140 [Bacteroidetes bacterium RIFOXYC
MVHYKKSWNIMMMNLFIRIIFKTLILLVFALSSKAEITYESYLDLKKMYPNESIIQLYYGVFYDISLENGELNVTYTSRERILFFGNASHLYSDRSVFSNIFMSIEYIEANSYILSGTKYKKVAVKDFKEIQRPGESVFYDGSKEVNIIFPGIAAGTVIELNTTHKINDPEFLRYILFQHYLPTYELEAEVLFDNAISLEMAPFNVTGSPFNKEVTKNRTLLHYKANKVECFKVEKFTPDMLHYVPHIYPIIKNYSYKGVTTPVIQSVSDLYHHYYPYIADVATNIDTYELKHVADSVTKDVDNELDKTKALYYWVQSHIKYIAFEDGLGGFIPRKPNKVLEKRYGDCKDKSALLQSLLHQVGITSYLTWVGTRDIPYKYADLPTAYADNHMIVTYPFQGKNYFLDATSKYLTIDQPSAFTQGKETLISIDSINYMVETIPVVEPMANFIYDSVYLAITSNHLKGKGFATSKGYTKSRMQYRLEVEDEKEKKDVLESSFEKGSNKFILDDFQLVENVPYSDSIVLNYQFTLDDYLKKFNQEIYLNLNLNKTWLESKIEVDRKYPMEFEFNGVSDNVFVFEIPEGYFLQQIPTDVNYENELAAFNISYQLVGQNVIYRHRLMRKQLIIYPKDFDQWRNFILQLDKNYKQTLLFKNNEN